jgi:flagellar motor switch protein FliM
MGVDARLEAIMHRFRTPFADVLKLREGDEIPLPESSIDRVRLIGLEGRTCALGRLGQSGGHRALRITAVGEVPMPFNKGMAALTAGNDAFGAMPSGGSELAFEPVLAAAGEEGAPMSAPEPMPMPMELPMPQAMPVIGDMHADAVAAPLPMAGLPSLSED